MKVLRLLLLFFAVTFSVSDSLAEARFFKANSVRIKYAYWHIKGSDANPDNDKIWYAEMWTGNDTIVDGHSCVTLWDQNEGEEPVLVGCLREDENGYIWRYYLNYSKMVGDRSSEVLERHGMTNSWAFLYDFSNPDWKEGTTIELGHNSNPLGHYTVKLYGVDMLTAENGEEIPEAWYGFLIYGIGRPDYLFENRILEPSSLYGTAVLEYWRDGELLLKNWMLPEPVKEATMIEPASMSTSSEAKSYDLAGRPVDGTQKGILIRNGKKVIVK